MISKILFLVGTCKQGPDIASAYCVNRANLKQHGVLYPDDLSTNVLAPGIANHGQLFSLAQAPDAPLSLDILLRKIEIKTEDSHFPQRTLVFSAFLAFQTPDVLTVLHAAVNRVFPNVECAAFFTLSRQDREIEAQYGTYRLLHNKALHTNLVSFCLARLEGYSKYIDQLHTIFGQKNVHCYIDDTLLDSTLAAQKESFRAAGLLPAEIESDYFRFTPSLLNVIMPRSFWDFVYGCSAVRHSPLSTSGLTPWAEPAIRFAQDYPNLMANACSLDYSTRRSIVTHYSASNASLAKQFGMERLFPDPDPDWEPFTGLTEEVAFRIAERLDRDFAEAQLAEFEAAPVQYYTREQRIVHQALRDAIAPHPVGIIRMPRPVPKLSVLTLTYNHEKFIEDNMRSVLEQDVDFPIQHIIADDGSSDDTQDIILDYASKYSHIVPVFQKNRSYGPRNVRALFDLARSPYVAICEGDDYFCNSGKLRKQLEFLEANPHFSVCFHPVKVLWDDNSHPESVFPPPERLPRKTNAFLPIDLLRTNFIPTPSVMYRWRFTKGVPDWFNANCLPGDWYWHLLHAEQGKVGMLPDVMSVYRRHANAIWVAAETDIIEQKARFGIKELRTYVTVDEHFEGRYRQILYPLIINEFITLLDISRKHEKKEYLEQAVKEFPTWGGRFMMYLEQASVKK